MRALVRSLGFLAALTCTTGAAAACQSVGRVAGELAAGTGGMVLGTMVGLGAGVGVKKLVAPKSTGPFARTGALAGAALGAAGGVALVGSRGSFLMATGGAAAGVTAAVLASKLGDRLAPQPRKKLQSVTFLLLPSLGATVAFNLSRAR